MTRHIYSQQRGRLERLLAAFVISVLAALGLLPATVPAVAASQDVPAQAEYQPTVTVTSRSADVDTPGHALITVNYRLTKDDVPGSLYIAFFHGATPSDGGFIDDENMWITKSGPQTYEVDRTLIPGDYSIRIQGKYGADCQGRECYGQVKLAEDLAFTVTAAPTPTATPTPTDAPTPEPTTTTTPTPEPTTSASPAPSPTTTAASVSASLSTTTVTPGGQVTVTGRGYVPGEAIELWLHSNPVKLATLTASADGTFSRTVTVPEATEGGAHRIEVRAATSGTISLNLTVVAGLAVTGADSSPTVALGGVAVLLLAAGVSVAVARRRRTRSEGAL